LNIIDQQLIFSPTDLVIFSQSTFASWMQRYSLQYPDKAPKKDTEDGLNTLLQKRGYIHEDALESEFVGQGLLVVHIQRENAKQATLAAMHDGADVVAQGYLAHENFAGFADFLIKQPGS
jgi:uncharacterized protein